MTDAPQKSTGKIIAIIVVVAIVAGIVATLIQSLLLGHSNPAVTGGAVGAISAVVAISLLKKKPA